MLAAPSIAIDLPPKDSDLEDGQGRVWVSYNSPAYLEERHGLPQELLQNIAVVEPWQPKPGSSAHQPPDEPRFPPFLFRVVVLGRTRY